MNNKGQALVEFILVLPILILIIFGVIEIGNIVSNKYKLEQYTSEAIEMYKENPSMVDNYARNNDITIEFKNKDDLMEIIVSKKVSLVSPSLTGFLGNPYLIKTKRTFYAGWSYE